ncbi:putative cephalosporin C regulator 1 [Microdochium trichocladiopsis]|uniref:Cephalosporin C regulator 1 n=1 Tax=Microdochium trichocladiopsis TaxID=1682393 RepID=A0A9P9BS29_9PEZI|nr:putative cephalosporin C regulator 1 [Microdochium trichocladiopsis]KAH7033430.1 putative cephalosporin C regulator 1 [Microdochium trichocladiopsis]
MAPQQDQAILAHHPHHLHHHQHPESRKRAQSRASTASIHSIATQPNVDQAFAAHHAGFVDQWAQNEHAQQTRDMSAMAAQQMSAEELMLRPTSQMQAHAQSFSMDTSMQSSMGPGASFPQHGLSHGMPADSFATANASFTEPDSQMMDDNDEGDSFAGLPSSTKGAGASSRTSANNELEMRQLFQSSKHRNLQEVAKELHGNERGPNSERTRQVFAMLWINQVCSKGKGSVPRGRVYANYASRCATERITVLNPASFGKLVRVLFPGLKTRRLGVRGESKYHYVNFSLMDDQPELREPAIQPAIPFPEPASFAQSINGSHSQSPALQSIDRPQLPSPAPNPQTEVPTVRQAIQIGSHSVYNQPDVSSIEQLQTTTAKTALTLSFAPDPEDAFRQSEPLTLPRIEPFLPKGTDVDAAKSLTALYRSHCTSLVECIRYCKEKTFFHLYTSFQGTLTMPVQKLFSNPAIAAWIEECDFVLYQRMMRIISGLTLQVVPKQVLDTLRNISERLIPHIRESFQGQPRHVVLAKEAPAAIFAGLLDRALRVNLTAHAAANMLSNPANRDQMYVDWITMVRLRKVAECVPTRAMDDLVNLLLHEIRELLDPVNIPWELECLTLYGDMALQRNNKSPRADNAEQMGSSNILERWVNFLSSLSKQFPYASPADVVWCVQRVGTETMRDLTIAQGKSFGSWWVTKCWVDEMISFLAEKGGFMLTKNASSAASAISKPAASSKETARSASGLGSTREGAKTMSAMQQSQPQPDRAPFPSQLEGAPGDMLHLSTNHDDSGIGPDSDIGIRTPEEDFPLDKFEFQQTPGQALQALESLESL